MTREERVVANSRYPLWNNNGTKRTARCKCIVANACHIIFFLCVHHGFRDTKSPLYFVGDDVISAVLFSFVRLYQSPSISTFSALANRGSSTTKRDNKCFFIYYFTYRCTYNTDLIYSINCVLLHIGCCRLLPPLKPCSERSSSASRSVVFSSKASSLQVSERLGFTIQ